MFKIPEVPQDDQETPDGVADGVALPPGMSKGKKMERRVVTTKELAEALDVDPRTIIKAAKDGKIPAFRVDKEFRFDPAAVRIALSNNARSKK